MTLILGLSGNLIARPHKGKWKKIKAELNLSEEQSQKIKAIRKSQKSERKVLRKELQEMREKLETALQGKQTDDELRALFKQVESSKLKKRQLHFETMLQIRNILSEEQRLKFNELRKSNKEKRKARRQQELNSSSEFDDE